VQSIGERCALPGEDPGRPYSREQDLAGNRSNSLQTQANLFGRPEWSEAELRDWQLASDRLGTGARGDGGGSSPSGGANPARTNPPLYYAFESVPYLVGTPGTIFTRLHLMRLASVLFLLVAVAATYKLTLEFVGDRRLLALAGAATVGLQPMAVFVSSSVNPDSLLIAAFAVAMLFGVRILRRGLTAGRGVALCGACAVAVLTKATGYALVPPMLLALVIGALRATPGLGPRVKGAALPALAFGIPVAAWLLAARLADRPAINQVGGGGGAGQEIPGFVSYLWQFYLPKLPFQTALPGPFGQAPAFDLWVEGGWAAFGWLEVVFPRPLYVVLAVLTGVMLVGALVSTRRHAVRRDVPAFAFLALVALGLLAGLHAAEYKVFSEQGTILNQGRYLLPLVPLLGLAAAGSLSLLEGRRRAAATGVLLAGLFALQIFSLALIAVRFHA